MTYERKVLTMQAVLSRTLSALRLTWRQNLKISVFGVTFPQLALSLYLDLKDHKPVQFLRELSIPLGHRRDAMSFRDLLKPAFEYASQMGLAVLVVGIWTLVAYFALVQLNIHAAQTGGTLSVRSSVARGLKSAVPRGFLLFLLTLFFVGTLAQIAVALMIFFLAVALMIPVILGVEYQGVMGAFRSAVFMRYVRSSRYSKWNVFFTLMTVSAFLYALVAAAAYAGSQLMVLDEILEIPRDFWLIPISGTSFGPFYLGLVVFETLVTSLAFSFAAAMSVSVYFAVFTKRVIHRV